MASVPSSTAEAASATNTDTSNTSNTFNTTASAPNISVRTVQHNHHAESSCAVSSSASSIHEDANDVAHRTTETPPIVRPKLSTRKSSGTIIVDREHPRVELSLGEEVFDEDDARAMSPRRNSEDLEKMSQDARRQLSEHAKILQQSLLEIFNRIEAVKEEHDKLDNNNKFLQKYIGDLMSTSKITSTGASGRKK